MLIDGKDSVRALRAVHSRFYLATLPLAVGIVGPGAIGSTFMSQLMQQKEVWCHLHFAVFWRGVGVGGWSGAQPCVWVGLIAAL